MPARLRISMLTGKLWKMQILFLTSQYRSCQSTYVYFWTERIFASMTQIHKTQVLLVLLGLYFFSEKVVVRSKVVLQLTPEGFLKPTRGFPKPQNALYGIKTTLCFPRETRGSIFLAEMAILKHSKAVRKCVQPLLVSESALVLYRGLMGLKIAD